jgi:hypothetical protein
MSTVILNRREQMKRLVGFNLILALGMTASAGQAAAQEKMIRDQLVGTWTIVSCAGANGGTPAACAAPRGGMIFGAGGRFAVVWAGTARKLTGGGGGRARRSPEEYKAAAEGLVAIFGNWTFDEAGQRFSFRTEASLFSNGGEGGQTFSFIRTGDELKVVQVEGNAGNGNSYVFRRAP